jgi:hypothetical protein
VRARALRAPVFLGSSPRQTGRCAPRRPSQLRCFFLCIPKIKYSTESGRSREGLFSFNSTTEAREYTECQAFYTVVQIGSPTPSTARECCSPPLDQRGETHSLPDEGVRGTNSDDGAYTLVLQVYNNYNTSTTEAMKYNFP